MRELERISALRDAELAEVLARGAEIAHVVRGEEREARIRAAGAVRIDGVARELAEVGEREPERVDMVRIAGEARHDVHIARLHRARGPAKRHHAARAAERHVIEPARRKAEMLRETDRRIRREREAGDGKSVDLLFAQAGLLQQIGEAAREQPVRGANGVADVRHGYGHRNGYAFVASPHLRRFRSRRSKELLGFTAKSARRAFCTLFVDVTGSSARKATWPGALKYARRSRHQSWMESAVSRSALAFGASTTHAMTSSSRTLSGAAMTATCPTAGWPASAASTSSAAMFSPARRMMFLRRSPKWKLPSSPRRMQSPVWNQPSRQASSVAFSSFR